MYLSVVLSTICIMFYQYQLSKASLLSLPGTNNNGNNNNNNIENEVATLNKHTKHKIVSTKMSTSTTTTIPATSLTTTMNDFRMSAKVNTKKATKKKNSQTKINTKFTISLLMNRLEINQD